MSENGSIDSKADFLARVQRFTDQTLDDLNGASKGRDVDEKEARTLRSLLLKLLRIWDKALLQEQRDPRSEETLRQVEKRASRVKTGEA